MKKRKVEKISIILVFIAIIITGIYTNFEKDNNNVINDIESSYEISNIPIYNGEISIIINNNIPKFSDEDIKLEVEYYSDLKDGKVRNGNYKN